MPELDTLTEFMGRAALREISVVAAADLATGLPIPLTSTCLASMAYDLDSQDLELEFVSGHSFSYGGVPPEIALGLYTAPSPGGYYNSEIKGKF